MFIHSCNELTRVCVWGGAGIARPRLRAQQVVFLMSFLSCFMGPKISSTGPASMNVLLSYHETRHLQVTSAPAVMAPSSPQPI